MEKPADGPDADAALWGKAGGEDICHAGAGCGWISEYGLCEFRGRPADWGIFSWQYQGR